VRLDAYSRIDIVVAAKGPSNKLALPFLTHSRDKRIDKLQGLIGHQTMGIRLIMTLDNLLWDRRKNLQKGWLLRRI
jgi:hypothetical protein